MTIIILFNQKAGKFVYYTIGFQKINFVYKILKQEEDEK